jgi:PAS domain S-box-containing protein
MLRIGQSTLRLSTLLEQVQAVTRTSTNRFLVVWRNYIPIVLVALLGVVMTGLLFRELTNWEQQRVQNAFKEAAHDRILIIQREVVHALGLVQDLGNFIDASPRIGRREFRNFVNPALKRHDSIQALEWVPRVTVAEYDAFLKEARRSFSRFRITEQDDQGKIVRAVPRSEHFPILYVQPYLLNKGLLGFDMASHEMQLKALLEAADAGEKQVSAPVPISRDGVERTHFGVYLPIYHKTGNVDQESFDDEDKLADTAEQRRQQLRGFAVGVFRISDIVEQALASLTPGGIDIRIYDASDEDERQLMYHHVSRLRAEPSHLRDKQSDSTVGVWEFTGILDVANRQWPVVCNPVTSRFQPDPWNGWVVIAGGLAFTTLLTVYLTTLVGQAAKVKRLVGERTELLVKTNTALVKEIREHKQTEEKLRESEEEFRSLIETALSVVLWLSPDGRIRAFNREAERLYGQRQETVLGKNYLELFVPEQDREYVASDIKKVLAGEPTRGFENAVTAPDGTEHTLVWNVNRLLDAQGQPRGVIAVGQDITMRKHAEQALRQLNETLEQRVALRSAEAERRAQELEQFAYVASHDLKAPLRAIGNLASWLQEDLEEKLTDDSLDQLTLLKDRVQRMQALIEGLLKYSRIGAMESSKEAVDTTQLLAEIIDSLSPPEKFILDIAHNMPTLRTNRLQLGQVFANLIGNSIKHHGSEQGHVWVTVRDDGAYYEFSVADDGPGIAPEYHEKVFMMFQTLETKDYGNDTGIGLALVKKIVQEQGGSITLDSEESKGAAFRFTWPK